MKKPCQSPSQSLRLDIKEVEKVPTPTYFTSLDRHRSWYLSNNRLMKSVTLIPGKHLCSNESFLLVTGIQFKWHDYQAFHLLCPACFSTPTFFTRRNHQSTHSFQYPNMAVMCNHRYVHNEARHARWRAWWNCVTLIPGKHLCSINESFVWMLLTA